MMTCLVFTADGLLHDSSVEGPPLASVAGLPEESVAERQDHLLRGEREHRIVPSEPSGWRLELRDAEDRCTGGFAPFRLRRGGRLRSGEVGLTLRGNPARHDAWTFSGPGRLIVEAIVASGAEARVSGSSGADGPSGVKVLLTIAAPIDSLAGSIDALTLGCWLIAQWHGTPAVDHVLSAAPAGSGLVSALRASSLAGISPRAEN